MKTSKIILLLIVLGTLSINANATKLASCMSEKCVNYFNKFKLSAKRGQPVAMATLGQFYQFGYGTNKNEELAIKYYEKSSRLSNPLAQYKAGLLYLSSDKYKDVNKGIKYLEKSAKNNYKESIFLLAIIYINKEFGAYNLSKADKYLAKAYDSKHNDIPAVIDYLNETYVIHKDTFPDLINSMKRAPLEINSNSMSVWPDDITEKITITAPPIEDIFHAQLISFRKRTSSTGTRFSGRSCKQMKHTCTSLGDGLSSSTANGFYRSLLPNSF